MSRLNAIVIAVLVLSAALVVHPEVSIATGPASYGLYFGGNRNQRISSVPPGAGQIQSSGVTSFALGGFLWFDTAKSVSLGTEPLLLTKGSKSTEQSGSTTIITETSEPYLSLPVLVRYDVPRLGYLSLVGGTSAEIYLAPTGGVRKRATLGVLLGVGAEFGRMSLNVRYSRDLTDAINISQGGLTFSEKNSGVVVLFGLRLSAS